MQRLFKLSVILVFTLFCTASCQKEQTPELNVSVSAMEVANYQGSSTFEVQSNMSWTVTTDDPWLTISPVSGSGNGAVTVTAMNNYTSSSRSGNIRVTCKNLVKLITVAQTNSVLSVDNSTLAFQKGAENITVNITSNTAWTIEIPSASPWITANTLSGVGNGSVTFTTTANNANSIRSTSIILKYASTQIVINASQRGALNGIPTQPVLTFPSNGATAVGTIPIFRWNASTDADNDPVSYKFQISKDNVNWKDSVLTSTSLNFKYNLEPYTTYYWRVTASDAQDNSVSSLNTFTTGPVNFLADGEFSVILNNTTGANPCEIIFIGDGYTAADYQTGGLFDQDVATGLDAFFNVEPYKTYKSYFKAYKIGAFSAESGITQQDKSITKQTCFSSYFAGGSSTSTNTDKVFTYARKITGITAEKLKSVLIVLMLNEDRYAGTCFMWSDGKAIAICPVSKTASSSNTRFPAIVNHEAGGHGWAGLADEYVSSANSGKTITAEAISSYQSWSNYGFNANVDVTGVPSSVKWYSFIGISGYERVGAYEGALYYTYGAWRAESTSCMINNIPYYSAPSREAAVKKIMRVSGGTYNRDNFVSNDLQKSPSSEALLQTKSFNPLTFIPLAPPVRVK